MTVTRDGTEPRTEALLVYGVVRAGSELPEITGVGGSALRAVAHGPVAAVVGAVEEGRSLAHKADLTAYHQVVDALAGRGPVVPVRFGSALADDAGVVDDLLAPQEDRLAQLLDALEGRSQLVLRARYVEEAVLAEVVAADPRIRELNDRTRGVPEQMSWADRVRLGELVAHAVDQRRQHDADDLLDRVLPHVVEHQVRRGAGLDHVVEAALLVDDDQVPALEQVLETYAEAVHERVRLSLMGPLAPYDFVGEA
ncbi:GvpL/GvpF family gas vesicle protein [Nocardioides sp. TF02-7]|uniref:GvpL/GvpF family gas vesicle protein n=1 Tax=Nocardioides sp. TF02-7 TaxID=2917724 RepID=UPI001F0604D6|nr:GvpL/GvpF family gas vesicle protein [Nocardioides sp. TF02-7]UMG94344.1 GvpL/GvpF family gas vesicle protein [Nocardioides sp. TF02-7]